MNAYANLYILDPRYSDLDANESRGGKGKPGSHVASHGAATVSMVV